MSKYILTATHNFESAHHLVGHNGKCANSHGHSYQVQIEVGGDSLIKDGSSRDMIMDFTDIKNTFKKFIDFFDHCYILEGKEFKEHIVTMQIGMLARIDKTRVVEVPFRPTAERYSEFFYNELTKLGIPVHAITVWETRNNACRYEG